MASRKAMVAQEISSLFQADPLGRPEFIYIKDGFST
jgi:hypothetical protein